MWVGVLGVSYSLTEGILFFFLIIGIVVSQKMSISVFQALRWSVPWYICAFVRVIIFIKDDSIFSVVVGCIVP